MTQQLPAGFKIGHHTDAAALTGCTVILCPPNTVGSCDVRGSSPSSRELALLAPDKTMQQVNSVLLTGGSAYGLAAADGVMKFLEERDTGYQTPWGKVPIVPAAVVFDLNIGSGAVRPDAAAGYAACLSASDHDIREGSVGAGTGATVGKWAGIETRMRGGFGLATRYHHEITVTAAAVVNAIGDIMNADGTVLAGAKSKDGRWMAEADPHRRSPEGFSHTNTTLVAVLTNATLSKVQAYRVAQRAHDGMARAIKPAHTTRDGDVTFCLASCEVRTNEFDLVAELGADATAHAIRCAVLTASAANGVPAVL